MERLAKLLLMLSSSNDGEVLAAARAAGRCLAEQGKDWHWLAEVVRRADGGRASNSDAFEHLRRATERAEAEARRRREQQRETDPFRTYETGDSVAPMRVREAVLRCAGQVHGMAHKEREFVWAMKQRIDQYGDCTLMSAAQQKWILDLERRYVEGFRRW